MSYTDHGRTARTLTPLAYFLIVDSPRAGSVHCSTMPRPRWNAPRPRTKYSYRTLLNFSKEEMENLRREAASAVLPLATYLRQLIIKHPERASGAGTR